MLFLVLASQLHQKHFSSGNSIFENNNNQNKDQEGLQTSIEEVTTMDEGTFGANLTLHPVSQPLV